MNNKNIPNLKPTKKTNKQFNLLKSLLISILVLGLFIGGYYLYDWYSVKQYEVPSVQELKDKKEEINYSDKDNYQYDPNLSNYINELPSIRSQYNNNNIMARLEIPGLEIDTYVARTTNNEYYLNHNAYNAYDELGYPFIDYRNKDLNNARQINIYGHNSQVESLQDKLEMINLRAYLDKNFFDNYKYMYLSIDEGKYKYRVEAVKVVTASDPEHMKVIFYGDDDFVTHTKKLYQNTLYIRGDTTITKNDKLLVLQICNYNPVNSYLIVIGKQM